MMDSTWCYLSLKCSPSLLSLLAPTTSETSPAQVKRPAEAPPMQFLVKHILPTPAFIFWIAVEKEYIVELVGEVDHRGHHSA